VLIGNIFKQIIPCIDYLFVGKKRVVLRALRLVGCIRAVMGIEAITVKHIAHDEQLLAELSSILPVRVSSLRKWILTLHSQRVSDILKKDFGFIKMHNLSHAFSDIKRKGHRRTPILG
jgi:hypothetical protein